MYVRMCCSQVSNVGAFFDRGGAQSMHATTMMLGGNENVMNFYFFFECLNEYSNEPDDYRIQFPDP